MAGTRMNDAPVEAGLAERAKFLEDAAKHFENMPTKGEDRAHWANVYNAKNCREISALLTAATEGQSYWQARAERAEGALHEGRRAIGDHFAPNDCYATGPLTGDSYRDLVQCPACSFIAMYDATLADAQQTQKEGK